LRRTSAWCSHLRLGRLGYVRLRHGDRADPQQLAYAFHQPRDFVAKARCDLVFDARYECFGREQAGGRTGRIVHTQAIENAQHPFGMRQHAFAGRQQRGRGAVGHLAHESQGPFDQAGVRNAGRLTGQLSRRHHFTASGIRSGRR